MSICNAHIDYFIYFLSFSAEIEELKQDLASFRFEIKHDMKLETSLIKDSFNSLNAKIDIHFMGSNPYRVEGKNRSTNTSLRSVKTHSAYQDSCSSIDMNYEKQYEIKESTLVPPVVFNILPDEQHEAPSSGHYYNEENVVLPYISYHKSITGTPNCNSISPNESIIAENGTKQTKGFSTYHKRDKGMIKPEYTKQEVDAMFRQLTQKSSETSVSIQREQEETENPDLCNVM